MNHIQMAEECNIILKFSQDQKPLRIPLVIYVDTECLLEEISTCDNNLHEPYTTKIYKHTVIYKHKRLLQRLQPYEKVLCRPKKGCH